MHQLKLNLKLFTGISVNKLYPLSIINSIEGTIARSFLIDSLSLSEFQGNKNKFVWNTELTNVVCRAKFLYPTWLVVEFVRMHPTTRRTWTCSERLRSIFLNRFNYFFKASVWGVPMYFSLQPTSYRFLKTLLHLHDLAWPRHMRNSTVKNSLCETSGKIAFWHSWKMWMGSRQFLRPCLKNDFKKPESYTGKRSRIAVWFSIYVKPYRSILGAPTNEKVNCNKFFGKKLF